MGVVKFAAIATIIGVGLSLFTAFLAIPWAVEDRIHSRIQAEVAPLREDVRDIKNVLYRMAEARGL